MLKTTQHSQNPKSHVQKMLFYKLALTFLVASTIFFRLSTTSL